MLLMPADTTSHAAREDACHMRLFLALVAAIVSAGAVAFGSYLLSFSDLSPLGGRPLLTGALWSAAAGTAGFLLAYMAGKSRPPRGGGKP